MEVHCNITNNVTKVFVSLRRLLVRFFLGGSSIFITIFHFSLNLIFHIPTDNFPLGSICHALRSPCLIIKPLYWLSDKDSLVLSYLVAEQNLTVLNNLWYVFFGNIHVLPYNLFQLSTRRWRTRPRYTWAATTRFRFIGKGRLVVWKRGWRCGPNEST
jgi:hypothetical protein